MSQNEMERQAPQTEEDLSTLLRVRREKLADLRERGKDPFAVTTYPVDSCAREINENFEEYEGRSFPYLVNFIRSSLVIFSSSTVGPLM